MARLDEFALIDRWLSHFPAGQALLGPGDDAAAVLPTPGQALVSTVDALVEGVHFDHRCPPADLGWKALAVNLSDLAAMGARPRWALVALGRGPDLAADWLDAVGEGMAAAAAEAGVEIIGGNVSGARQTSFTVTLLGECAPDRLLTRAGGRPGDLLYASGTLGDSAAGLARLGEARPPGSAAAELVGRHCRPTPRLALGRAVGEAQVARACVDVSDGLAADLGHLAAASGVGARVVLADLPVSAALAEAMGPQAARHAAVGGEDYELVFAVDPAEADRFEAVAAATKTPVRRIGVLTAGDAVVLVDEGGAPWRPDRPGWVHG